MKNCWPQYMMAVLIFFMIASPVLAAHRGEATQQPVPGEKGNSTTACLECHGPFDKLASAPSRFITQSGEKITPHRYIPHDLKEIPDCVSCHKPHSANPTKTELDSLPNPDVTTCFGCHHAENFKPCKSCHKGN